MGNRVRTTKEIKAAAKVAYETCLKQYAIRFATQVVTGEIDIDTPWEKAGRAVQQHWISVIRAVFDSMKVEA